MITFEFLRQQKREAEAERNRLLAAVHQLGGAINLLDLLIRTAEQEPEAHDQQGKE